MWRDCHAALGLMVVSRMSLYKYQLTEVPPEIGSMANLQQLELRCDVSAARFAHAFLILPVAVVATACIVLAVGFESLQHDANI
jgi:hypothetical protein